MNTTQLECFMAVANFLNFSRAAESLRLTQPAVSHQISTLENEMGVRLFHRTSKSVRLTQEGYVFTQYAGEMLKLTRTARSRLQESRRSQPMRLGIGCRSTFDLGLVQRPLELFRQEQPNLLPILRIIPFDSLENLLEDGEIQLMFAFQESAPKKAQYREMARCPVVCACAEGHPLAARSTLSVQDLKAAGRVVTFHPPVYPPSLFHIQSQIIAGQMPDQLFFCDNLEVLNTMVAAGFGFAIVADFPHMRHPGVRYIPLTGLEPLSFGAAYMRGDSYPILRRFLELVEDCIHPDEALQQA